jgi:hypothetical protein
VNTHADVLGIRRVNPHLVTRKSMSSLEGLKVTCCIITYILKLVSSKHAACSRRDASEYKNTWLEGVAEGNDSFDYAIDAFGYQSTTCVIPCYLHLTEQL